MDFLFKLKEKLNQKEEAIVINWLKIRLNAEEMVVNFEN